MTVRVKTWRRQRLGRAVAGMLVAALVWMIPGSGMVFGAPAADATGVPASLTVASDPVGAAVFVDGQARGTTPLALDPIAVGEHRVRISLDGYLEHSRAVVVRAGGGESLHVDLTPRPAPSLLDEPSSSGTSPQAPVVETEGGSRKKLALIGAGVVVAGVVGYAAFSGGGEPTVGDVTAQPSGTGLAGATSFTFSATASAPGGGTLSYRWDFGDGQTSTAQRPAHTYAQEGTFTVSLTVTDEDGQSASGSTQVTVRGLSGTWVGNLDTFIDTTIVLNQAGALLTGSYNDSVGNFGIVTGQVTDPRNVTLEVKVGVHAPWTFEGFADSEIGRLDGRANGSGFVNATWYMTR